MRITHKHIHHAFGWSTVGLGLLTTLLMTYGFVQPDRADLLQARLLPAHMRGEVPWKKISGLQIHKGISAPPSTNIIFTIPDGVGSITRKTLFGRKGHDVRYWGYCFPQGETRNAGRVKKRTGFPGVVFLSEKENYMLRARVREQRKSTAADIQNLTQDDLNEADSIRGQIWHQKDTFEDGDICYLMTEAPLPLGIDEDGDTANTQVEKELGSNPLLSDTDEDGLVDGLEHFRLGTKATIRDTDGDGLIDGIEDANQNGRTDTGETSPVEWDSDRDGLCDGYCVVSYNIRTGFSAPVGYVPDFEDKIVWEDKNLNGVVDDNETDPLKIDTDEDGIYDEVEFFECFLQQQDDSNCLEP